MENESEDFIEVIVHAIAGKSYVDEEGFLMLPMHVEHEEKMIEAHIAFADEDSILEVQKYLSSPKSMENPLKLVI